MSNLLEKIHKQKKKLNKIKLRKQNSLGGGLQYRPKDAFVKNEFFCFLKTPLCS